MLYCLSSCKSLHLQIPNGEQVSLLIYAVHGHTMYVLPCKQHVHVHINCSAGTLFCIWLLPNCTDASLCLVSVTGNQNHGCFLTGWHVLLAEQVTLELSANSSEV